MTTTEKSALLNAGIIISKRQYGTYTKCMLLPPLLFKYNSKTWPVVPEHDYDYCHGHGIGVNTAVIVFLGHEVGLSVDENGEKIGVSLNHPLSKYWLDILQPIWNKQNESKCPTCHGTGWDGCGYILNCDDCGGTGIKNEKVSKI